MSKKPMTTRNPSVRLWGWMSGERVWFERERLWAKQAAINSGGTYLGEYVAKPVKAKKKGKKR